jgi:two-component system, LytTR family, response regulator
VSIALVSEPDTQWWSATRVKFVCGPRSFFVRPADVVRIEGEGNYSRVYTPSGSFLVRESVGAAAKRLEAYGFCRVHKSTVVNVQYVREVRRTGRRAHVVVLADGTECSLAYERREALETALS